MLLAAGVLVWLGRGCGWLLQFCLRPDNIKETVLPSLPRKHGSGSWCNFLPCLCRSGLQVVLYIDEADYNPFLVTSSGAKIMVHDQNEYPFIEDIGTEIETAAATSIGMHFVSGNNMLFRSTFALVQL